MKNKKIIFFLFLLVFTTIHLSLIAESYIKSDTVLSVKKLSKNDVIIISENNAIDISGEKAEFIIFSFTKKIKFKILSSAGVKRFSKVTLPEAFDPSFISHFPKDRNYTNAFSKLKCNYFNGTVISKNGEKKDLIIKQTIEQIKMVMPEDDVYGNFEKFNYQIDNLNIGDEVSIEYNYDIPYRDNYAILYCSRIFFNNDVYKENYQLSLSHYSNLHSDIYFKNNAAPDSIIEKDNKKFYYWSKSNLPGCIYEDGSYPYLSLPYIIFSIKPFSMIYTLPYSYEEKFIPFYALYSYIREKNHYIITKSVSEGVKSSQYLQIDKFINNETQDILNDSIGNQKLFKIHNTIVDDFSFENDTNYFKKIDTHDPRMGDYIGMRTIRDISRYDLYVALILKLNLNYFTVYVSDKRTGVINNEFFTPMYEGDYLLAVLLKNDRLKYLYPKKSKFGYYLNEIPFYFENTKARLVHLNDYKNYRNPINDTLRQVQLPHSYINDNTRKNNILVKINLDALSASFDARINLSGQYSTLIRGLYQYNYQDETINKLYNKKIWELNDQIQVINKEIKIESKEPPFPANINVQYIANNLLKKNGDTISINLKNWFNHIIYNNFYTDNRQMDFYPDFMGRDSYVYYLQFDKNIKLISTPDSAVIKNELGELIISTEQVNQTSVKITSYFATTTNKVTVDKINDVKDIFDRLQKLNNSSLLFKIE